MSSKKDHYLSFPQSHRKETIELELFDLNKDLDEKQNIALQNKKLVQKLLKKIDTYYNTGKDKNRSAKTFALDKKLKERLKTLGYID